ncbi:hypothetical protein TGVAND_277560 [Toxoplasma gondii VAND]|uniref:Uncharacterized protein n=1 Tax=Toxoplasma gondii VAND TaxID=933077 RepID=A0A086QA13_TOXGO|nr:hypothetical protein TGVAND_277560 [Toxoplasma gondii VAND]
MPRACLSVPGASFAATAPLSAARAADTVAASSSVSAPEEEKHEHSSLPGESRGENDAPLAPLTPQGSTVPVQTVDSWPEASAPAESNAPPNPHDAQKSEKESAKTDSSSKEALDGSRLNTQLCPKTHPSSPSEEKTLELAPSKTLPQPPRDAPAETGTHEDAQVLSNPRTHVKETSSLCRPAPDDQQTSSAGAGTNECAARRTTHDRPCGWAASSLPCGVYRLPRPPSASAFSDAFSGALNTLPPTLAFSGPCNPHSHMSACSSSLGLHESPVHPCVHSSWLFASDCPSRLCRCQTRDARKHHSLLPWRCRRVFRERPAGLGRDRRGPSSVASESSRSEDDPSSCSDASCAAELVFSPKHAYRIASGDSRAACGCYRGRTKLLKRGIACEERRKHCETGYSRRRIRRRRSNSASSFSSFPHSLRNASGLHLHHRSLFPHGCLDPVQTVTDFAPPCVGRGIVACPRKGDSAPLNTRQFVRLRQRRGREALNPVEETERDIRGLSQSFPRRLPRRRLLSGGRASPAITRRLSDACSESSTGTKHIPWAGVVTKDACKAAASARRAARQAVADAKQPSQVKAEGSVDTHDTSNCGGSVDGDRWDGVARRGEADDDPGRSLSLVQASSEADRAAVDLCSLEVRGEKDGACEAGQTESQRHTGLAPGDRLRAGDPSLSNSAHAFQEQRPEAKFSRPRALHTVPRTIDCSLSFLDEQSKCSSGFSPWNGTLSGTPSLFSDDLTCESSTTLFTVDGIGLAGPLRLPSIPPPLAAPSASALNRGAVSSVSSAPAPLAPHGLPAGGEGRLWTAESGRSSGIAAGEEQGAEVGQVDKGPASVPRPAQSVSTERREGETMNHEPRLVSDLIQNAGETEEVCFGVGMSSLGGDAPMSGSRRFSRSSAPRLGSAGTSLGISNTRQDVSSPSPDTAFEKPRDARWTSLASPRDFVKSQLVEERPAETRGGLPRLLPRIIYDPSNEEIGMTCSSHRSSSVQDTPTASAGANETPSVSAFELERNLEKADRSASATEQLKGPTPSSLSKETATLAGAPQEARLPRSGEAETREPRRKREETQETRGKRERQKGGEEGKQMLGEAGDAIVVVGRSTDRKETEMLRQAEATLPVFAFSLSSLALDRDGASESEVDGGADQRAFLSLHAEPGNGETARPLCGRDLPPSAPSFADTLPSPDRRVLNEFARFQGDTGCTEGLPSLLSGQGFKNREGNRKDEGAAEQKEARKSATEETVGSAGSGPQRTRPSRRGADSDATTVVPPTGGAPEERGTDSSRVDTEGSPSSCEDWTKAEQSVEDFQETAAEARVHRAASQEPENATGVESQDLRPAADRYCPAGACMSFVLHSELLSSDAESDESRRAAGGRWLGECAASLMARNRDLGVSLEGEGKREVRDDLPLALPREGDDLVGRFCANLIDRNTRRDRLAARRSCSVDSAFTEQPLEPPRKSSLASEAAHDVHAPSRPNPAPADASFPPTAPRATAPPTPAVPASEVSSTLVFSFSGSEGVTVLEQWGGSAAQLTTEKVAACADAGEPGAPSFSLQASGGPPHPGGQKPPQPGAGGEGREGEIFEKKRNSSESEEGREDEQFEKAESNECGGSAPFFSPFEETLGPPDPPLPAAAPERIPPSTWDASVDFNMVGGEVCVYAEDCPQRSESFACRVKDSNEVSGKASFLTSVSEGRKAPSAEEKSVAFAGLSRAPPPGSTAKRGGAVPSHIPLPALFSSFSGSPETRGVAPLLSSSASLDTASPFVDSSLLSSAREDPSATRVNSKSTAKANGRENETVASSVISRFAAPFSPSPDASATASVSPAVRSQETLPGLRQDLSLSPLRASSLAFLSPSPLKEEEAWGANGESTVKGARMGCAVCGACGSSTARQPRRSAVSSRRQSVERRAVEESECVCPLDTQALRALKLRTCWGLVEVTREGEFCFAFKARSELRDLYTPAERQPSSALLSPSLSGGCLRGEDEFDVCPVSVWPSASPCRGARQLAGALGAPHACSSGGERETDRDAASTETEKKPVRKAAVELLFVVEPGGWSVRVQEFGQTSPGRVLKRFHVECLSGRQALRYQYACEIVECLKQNSPKVILKKSGIGLFQLMSNAPADFTATFTSTFSLFISSIHLRRGVVCIQSRLGDALHLPADDVALLTQSPELEPLDREALLPENSSCSAGQEKFFSHNPCTLRRDTQSWASSSFADSEEALSSRWGRSTATRSTACSWTSTRFESRAEALGEGKTLKGREGGESDRRRETAEETVVFSGTNAGEFSFGPCASSAGHLSSALRGPGETKKRASESGKEKKRRQWEEVRGALAAAQLPVASVVQAWQVVLRAFAVCCEEEQRGWCTYTAALQQKLREIQRDDGERPSDAADLWGGRHSDKEEGKGRENLDVAQMRRQIYQSIFPISVKRRSQWWT